MPVLKHARKKLRQDKKRTLKNKQLRDLYKKALKTARKSPTDKNISKAFSEIDKAVKNHILHANKAARLKASLTKSDKTQAKLPQSSVEKKASSKAKKSTSKTTSKSKAKAK